MGSPAYMSPEQCKDSADVDLRSDIYSFGIIVYEMLAGRTPYVAASGTEMLIMHLTGTPGPLRELVADVPAHVEAAIKRALARAREDRFESIAAFVGALRGDTGAAFCLCRRRRGSCRRFGNPRQELSEPGGPVHSTTFSRATAEDADSCQRRGRPSVATAIGAEPVFRGSGWQWRWSGLALFLLVRPSHAAAPPDHPPRPDARSKPSRSPLRPCARSR